MKEDLQGCFCHICLPTFGADKETKSSRKMEGKKIDKPFYFYPVCELLKESELFVKGHLGCLVPKHQNVSTISKEKDAFSSSRT